MKKLVANIICAFVPSKDLRHKIRTHFVAPHPNMGMFSPFDIDNSRLIAELRTVGEFSYITNTGNMGDMLIASATLQFFDDNKLKYKMFNGEPADTIVYGGGGIWTRTYEFDWSKILPIFAAAKRVIILPSSFHDCTGLIDAMDERFVIFCRERKSYDYMTANNPRDAKIFLDHDMAFRITKKIFKGKRPIKIRDFPPITKFMRCDCEQAGQYESDFDLSIATFGDKLSCREWIDFSAKLMLYTVGYVDTVITDRLHVGIAAALMGRNVYLLDNTYGKLSGVYNQTMSGNPNVHFCTEMPHISK